MTIKSKLRIGLFGVGHPTYWKQYKGLRTRLEAYQQQIADRLQGFDVELVDLGLIDQPETAREAGDRFRQEGVELVFLYVSTYALSHTVLPVIQRCNKPVVVLNLQPEKAMNYEWFNQLPDRTTMTGEWLANCQACSIPEIANVFNRANIPFRQISGWLADEEAWQEIQDWIDAVRVAWGMRNNRMGFLGHYYGGMLDVYSDLTQQSVFFGTHVEILEMCELQAIREQVSEEAITQKIEEIHQSFEVWKECPAEEIRRAAQTAIALDELVAKHDLGSMAYYYDGQPGNAYEYLIGSVIAGNSFLTARHVPVAGEAEVKNVQAMKIMDLFDAGGSFTEFYACDFNDDVLLMGHDGPGHLAIADGKPILKPLNEYHGKPGKGISVEMKVKTGPVTILSVVQTYEGRLKLLVAEAETVAGPILEIGNTNSRYRFSIGVKAFINDWSKEGPAHHCAVGIGHIAAKIHKLGNLLDMEVVQVC